MKKIKIYNKIIIHCSFSNLEVDDHINSIRLLHTTPKSKFAPWKGELVSGFGFLDIGYHCFIDSKGKAFDGRSLEVCGSHCKFENDDSLGICLSGELITDFNSRQFRTLSRVLEEWCDKFYIPKDKIEPHNKYNKFKTCPVFNLEKFKEDYL